MAPVLSITDRNGRAVPKRQIINYMDSLIQSQYDSQQDFRSLESSKNLGSVAEHHNIQYVRPASSTLKPWMRARKKVFQKKLAAAQNNVPANNDPANNDPANNVPAKNVVQSAPNGQPAAPQNPHVPNVWHAQLDTSVAEANRLLAKAMETERVLVATQMRHAEELALVQAELDEQIQELTEKVANLERGKFYLGTPLVHL